ncbi:MAG: hypothetical protein HYW48_07520 [Deltaproteobacteria bacterium]|nr:hypothetical protein [Deltaproteobacteria bacterium]
MNTVNKITSLKIGMIPYWNLLPFRHELSFNRGMSIELKTGHPTAVNKWLSEGAIHLAPSSSICLNMPGFEMSLPMGVASDGAVKSVFLGLHTEHLPLLPILEEREKVVRDIFLQAQSSQQFDARQVSQIAWEAVKSLPSFPITECPSIVLPPASASSVGLAKFLYNIWFGCEAYKFMAGRNFAKLYNDKKPIELVIGDEALIKRPRFAKILDLGEFWKDLTGLPFVYAVWQSKGLCLNGWRKKILEVGELAEQKMHLDASDYLPSLEPKDESGNSISLSEYWKGIKYKLGPEEFRGLLAFLCLSRKISDRPLDHEIAVKLLRWQDLTL